MSKTVKNDYALRYKFNFDTNDGKGFSKKETKDGAGYTDAIVICSIHREGIMAHDGGTSHLFLSHDGQNNDGAPIPETELFSVWGSLTHRLAQHEFGDERDKILADAIKATRVFVLGEKRYEEIWGPHE